MRHLWPSHNPPRIIAEKRKPCQGKTLIAAFAGSPIRLKGHQTSKCLCRPGPHPLKKGKAVKEKTFNRLVIPYSQKLVIYLCPSRFTFKINVRMRIV
jgi:hypothetical protein